MNWKERLKTSINNPLLWTRVCSGVHCDACVFKGAVDLHWCVLVHPKWGIHDRNGKILLFRHLLSTVQDFDDNDEIRGRIAEMLDDPEKFLGKAEPETKYEAFYTDGGFLTYTPRSGAEDRWPPLKYLLQTYQPHQTTIAAFRDEKLLNRVRKLLEEDIEKRKR